MCNMFGEDDHVHEILVCSSRMRNTNLYLVGLNAQSAAET